MTCVVSFCFDLICIGFFVYIFMQFGTREHDPYGLEVGHTGAAERLLICYHINHLIITLLAFKNGLQEEAG